MYYAALKDIQSAEAGLIANRSIESLPPGAPHSSYVNGSGKYYGLVIGNDKYTRFPALKTAENDAVITTELLRSRYGYHVQIIKNGTRSDILKALDKLRSNLTPQDNLLIYYAGHGFFDQKAMQGYWLPVDAEPNTSANWISNADITERLRAIDAGHILVVADSCYYSGTLTRGVNVTMRNPDYFQKMAAMRSRTVLTSGGMEPVADNDGGQHSVFAQAFMNALEQNLGTMDGTELFTRIRRPVMLNSDQTPEYSDIRKAGHEGGDFLFNRVK